LTGSVLARVGLDDAGHDIALAELALLARGLAQRGGAESVEVAHRAGGRLVKQHGRVRAE
jgi:hypothetical protein